VFIPVGDDDAIAADGRSQTLVTFASTSGLRRRKSTRASLMALRDRRTWPYSPAEEALLWLEDRVDLPKLGTRSQPCPSYDV
jgi:hypothetical protein